MLILPRTASSRGNKLKRSLPDNEEKRIIICARCGCKAQSNFYITRDIDRSFFGKIVYCKDCVRYFYDKYLKKYKTMNLAVYYLCRKIDIPYIHSAYLGAVENINNKDSKLQGEDKILAAYLKNLSFSDANGWGYTFDDSQGEREIEGITSFDEITKIKRNRNINTNNNDDYEVLEYDTDVLISKWGSFDNEDLAYLESEYLDWEEKLNGINEKSIDIMVKQVCLQCNEIRKDRENGINVDKKIKTLQDLLKTSGLIELQTSSSENEEFGMALSEIEYSRPLKKTDPDFEDVDEMNKMVYGFLGGISRALGKENKYTKKFDDIYGKYSIDIIEDLRSQKSEEDIDQGDIDG